MRKYMYYIKEGNEEHNYPTDMVRIQEKRMAVNKGEETEMTHRNVKTGDTWKVTYVGLGYADFEDEDDAEERMADVIEEKLEEVGINRNDDEEGEG